MKEVCKYLKNGDCTKRPYLGDTNCPKEYVPTIEGKCRHRDIVFKEWCGKTLKVIPTADLIAELEKRRPDCNVCVNRGMLEKCHKRCVFMRLNLQNNFKADKAKGEGR